MKPQHAKFIKEFLKSGDAIGAYQKAYPKAKRNIASNCSKKLLKQKEIATAIKEEQAIRNEIYEKARAETISKQVVDEIASENEVKAMLTKMIRKKGVAAKEEIIKKGGKEVGSKQKVFYPSFQEQIHAAKTLNEMCGYEAPKENTINIRSLEPIIGMEITPKNETKT